MESYYKKLYLTLWNAMTDAIEMLDNQNYGLAKELLIKSQIDAEDRFIASDWTED